MRRNSDCVERFRRAYGWFCDGRLFARWSETTDVDRASDLNRHQVFTKLNPTCIALRDETKNVGRNDVWIV